jgi:hypothetical protein
MKKLLQSLMILTLLVLLLAPAVVLAVTPQREVKTLVAGAATFSNSADFVVYKYLSVQTVGTEPASNNVTVSHVHDGITNTLGTYISASGIGSLGVTGTVYVFKGGEIRVTGAGTNAGTARVVREVYP